MIDGRVEQWLDSVLDAERSRLESAGVEMFAGPFERGDGVVTRSDAWSSLCGVLIMQTSQDLLAG